MSLSNHTVSRELAIALREVGWPQEGALLYWMKPRYAIDFPWELRFAFYESFYRSYAEDVDWDIAASPTASELMEKIGPEFEITIGRSGSPSSSVWVRVQSNILIRSNTELFSPSEMVRKSNIDSSESNALAKLALFLVREGKMKF